MCGQVEVGLDDGWVDVVLVQFTKICDSNVDDRQSCVTKDENWLILMQLQSE